MLAFEKQARPLYQRIVASARESQSLEALRDSLLPKLTSGELRVRGASSAMEPALRSFFKEQIQFRLRDGTEVDRGVFIGSTEFLPVEVLRDDPDAFREEFDLWLAEVWKPEQQQRRDEILTLHGNEKRYADLRAAVGRQHVVPFVGSGMSVPSGLPTWSGLLRKISQFTQCDRAALERLLESFLFEEAADLLASGTTRDCSRSE